MFAVEQLEEAGCQLGAQMFQVDIQIREIFLTDEHRLADMALLRILISHCLDRGHIRILLRPSTKLSTTLRAVDVDTSFSRRHLPTFFRAPYQTQCCDCMLPHHRQEIGAAELRPVLNHQMLNLRDIMEVKRCRVAEAVHDDEMGVVQVGLEGELK